jgi:hypothetical protein
MVKIDPIDSLEGFSKCSWIYNTKNICVCSELLGVVEDKGKICTTPHIIFWHSTLSSGHAPMRTKKLFRVPDPEQSSKLLWFQNMLRFEILRREQINETLKITTIPSNV